MSYPCGPKNPFAPQPINMDAAPAVFDTSGTKA